MDSFFEAEVEMERKICRDVVCTSHKDEEGKHSRIMCLTSQFTQSLRTLPTDLLLFDAYTFCVCASQVFFGTCVSYFYICYYLLEISTTRT